MPRRLKNHVMDANLIASKQKYEIDYVVARFKKKGIKVKGDKVKALCKKYKRSRNKVYNAILRGE